MSISISGNGSITGVLTSYTFDKSVSIGGTLTYEDVTNVDSVGIITAQSGIELTGGSIQLGTGTTISSPTSNEFSVSTNGGEALRIDSSGRLLVGAATARTILQNSGESKIQVEATNGSAALQLIGNLGSAAGPVVFLGKSRGTSLGSTTVVQNGDTLGSIQFAGADGSDLDSGAATISCQVDGTPGANDMPGRLVFSTNGGGTSPTERMRISNDGTITFGTTPNTGYPGVGINPAASRIYGTFGSGGGIEVNAFNDGTTGGRGFFAGSTRGDGRANRIELVPGTNGVYLASGATSWSSLSDENTKTNLVNIEDGLTKIASLRSVTGRYITDDENTRRSFLIAQDVQKVLPEAVDCAIDEDGNLGQLGLRYADVIPLLVAALKESKERIETLEAKVAALKAS